MYNKLLDTFIVAAECGSFTKAAEQLHMTSPAVLKHINQLEDEIGLKLFFRTSRGVQLTDAGQALLDEAKYIATARRRFIGFTRPLMHLSDSFDWAHHCSAQADTSFCYGRSSMECLYLLR